MFSLTRKASLGLVGCLVTGCAATPDASINYFLAKSDGTLSVTQTLNCNTRNDLFVQYTVTPDITFSADVSARKSVPLNGLDGALSNTSITFNFYDDGRLKGVNTESDGQGESVFNAVFKLASTVAGAALPLDATEDKRTPLERLCDYINNDEVDENKKPVRSKSMILQYEGVIPAVSPNEDEDTTSGSSPTITQDAEPEGSPKEWTTVSLSPTSATRVLLKKMDAAVGQKDAVGTVTARISGRNVIPKPVTANVPGEAGTLLTMRQPMKADLFIEMGGGTVWTDKEEWKGSVELAHSGDGYQIPIPKSAVFGKQTFELAVTESGRLSKIAYGKDTGVGQAIGVVQTGADTFRRPEASEKAAALNAEADLIKAQQRLAKCRAEPEACE